MPQRSIRFPDDVHAALEAEALRLDRSFSWVVVKACELALQAQGAMIAQSDAAAAVTSMCRTCVQNGPPKTRPCIKCGHQR